MLIDEKQSDWIAALIVLIVTIIRIYLFGKKMKRVVSREMARIEAEEAGQPVFIGWRYQTMLERFRERLEKRR